MTLSIEGNEIKAIFSYIRIRASVAFKLTRIYRLDCRKEQQGPHQLLVQAEWQGGRGV